MENFIAKVKRIGNSKGVIIPPNTIELENLEIGDSVSVTIERYENAVKCTECGRIIRDDEYGHLRGKVWYCNECFWKQQEGGWCPSCGRFGLIADEHAIWCKYCGFVEAEEDDEPYYGDDEE